MSGHVHDDRTPTQAARLAANGQMRSMQPPAAQFKAEGEVAQKKDPIEGSTKASIIGADSLPVRSSTDPESEKTGTLKKGDEVEILEVSGNFTKIKGCNSKGNEVTGFVPSANVSTRARQLSEISTALDADMDDIYSRSFNEDKTVVEEWGATIIEKDGTYSAKNKRTGHDGGSLPGGYEMGTEDGEQVIGGVHSHPYSVSEGLEEGVSFSGGDISYMRDYVRNGFQHWAEAGTHRFALVISDEVKAKKFFDDHTSANIQSTWNSNFSSTKGTFQEKVIAAVKVVIGNNGANGIELYGSIDETKKTFDKL